LTIKSEYRYFGAMEETLPSSWTEDGMSKRRLVLVYQNKKNVYGFTSSENISNKTVIIDLFIRL
jgi:hypothetical protein